MPSRDIVENAWKAFASHDADRISAVFTEDAEWLTPPGNATALDGLIHRVREYMDTARGHRMVSARRPEHALSVEQPQAW